MLQRMYALYNRDKRALWSLYAISACLMGILIWLMQNQHSFNLSVLPGCHVDLSPETYLLPAFSLYLAQLVLQILPYVPSFLPRYFTLHLLDVGGAWGALFLFDAIVFALTIFNAYSTRRRLGRQVQADMPIHSLIIKDGATYFAAIALSNLANIITFIFGKGQKSLPGSLTVFTTCISVTMVCRLTMNIKEKADIDTMEFNLSVSHDGVQIRTDLPDEVVAQEPVG
ncbi:hypothetical protein MVEN_01330900 [Mycena venus]|uniref:Uncharacterized protein n=1 Tax=Mycena venus TaxID=2733690 RepID=A0A8H6Y1J7_9AGAR|nr:hypothetical protein MVEN_01330900 [Mycena venus]